jgi:serine/threonine protein kinase
MLSTNSLLQNRYLIIRLIGQGGMGAVYQANDQRLGSAVALKESHFMDSFLQEAFEREARLLAHLRHPALPRVTDHFMEGNSQFLVMEYIPGDDLATLLKKNGKPFPYKKVLQWACQLLEALDYLHSRQILHRDIKPQNLKVIDENQIILLDFGLAKGTAGGVTRVTTDVSVYGYTPSYSPLEQVQGVGTDARSDLYSLAASLYQFITGELPPNSLERASSVVANGFDPLQPPNLINHQIPPSISSTIMKALALNKEERPASAAEMRKELGCDQEQPSFLEETVPKGSKSKENVKLDLELDSSSTKIKPREKPKPKPKVTAEKIPSTVIVPGASVVAIKRLEEAPAPTGFFDPKVMGQTLFFQAESVRFTKIEETFQFYRDHLNVEFQALSKQAGITFVLWVSCVALGFCILVAGVIMMILGKITEGTATSVSTIIVYFIQRIFQQREDHYRKLVAKKRKHLEYGNQWLLAIQSIDAMTNYKEKMRRQARLVDVLTEKLQQVSKKEHREETKPSEHKSTARIRKKNE